MAKKSKTKGQISVRGEVPIYTTYTFVPCGATQDSSDENENDTWYKVE